MSLSPGTRLGPYEILSALGAGGMGEVYKARDTRLERTVAIKVLSSQLADDQQFRDRFDREAKAIAALTHPHICTLHDVGHQDGTAYLVMEYLEGETLQARLVKRALPLDQALKTAIEIASALDKAHRVGIIHRDLKPGNVMLTKAGAKLLDFGLAKASAPVVAGSGLSMLPTTLANLTAQGTILGTFQYMAPEQLEGQEADTRTDIFAFGAVVYEMLTGKKAFEGKSHASLIAAIIHVDPPAISTAQRLTPPVLDHIVGRCLAKDPDARWQSATDVMGELKWITESGVHAAEPASVVTRHRRRERMAWGLTALVTLLAIGVSVLYLRAPHQAALVRLTVSPPFGATRRVLQPFAISPDGQSIAFTAQVAGNTTRIFTRRLDSPEAQPLAGTDNATTPFWSPDSRSLGFVKQGGLYRAELDGRVPRRLCDVPGNAFRGSTWGSRGVIVFATDGGLLRVPDVGGQPTSVTTLEPGAKTVAHYWPWFLPDGQHLLFLELPAGQTRGVIWATSLDDPARIRIVESYGGAAYAAGWLLSTTAPPRGLVGQAFDPERLTLRGMPQLVRDRLPIANTNGTAGVAVSSSGVLAVDRPPPILQQLVWVDRAGRSVDIVGPSATINTFALAPDERRVVAPVTDRDSLKRDLWLFETGREDGTRLTYDGENKLRPFWALDGGHIYFTERTALGLELRTLAIGAAAATAFENPGSFAVFSDVTRDGRFVVFQSVTDPIAIWIQRVGNPSERRVLVKDQFGAVQARVSPDGRWLAYTLTLPSRTEIFVQPFDRPGGRIQVSVKGGIGPVWRDDSRELYYEGPNGVMAVPMSERAGALEAGTPQKLFVVRTQGFVSTQPHNVEVAAHGQKFLVNTTVGDSDNVPFEVTLNWTTGFKK